MQFIAITTKAMLQKFFVVKLTKKGIEEIIDIYGSPITVIRDCLDPLGRYYVLDITTLGVHVVTGKEKLRKC